VRADTRFQGLEPGRTLLFFDGVCGLCNRLVDYLMVHDKARKLRYAPLQGETFKALAVELPELTKIDSLVVAHRTAEGEPAQIYIRSQAALFALGELGGGWGLLCRTLRLVPRFLSDGLYRFVAKVRYRIFGKYAACRLPSTEERALFLP
jgi:predicted DCC family thiol-disulfide oxidoreductase YuxK